MVLLLHILSRPYCKIIEKGGSPKRAASFQSVEKVQQILGFF